MKKRKGFKLAELLAVIVILGIITSITVPIVTNQIDKYKTKVCVTQYDNILNAARSYTTDNLLALSDSATVTLSELDSKGYIDASSLKDPVTKETISSELQIHIVKIGKKYKYYLDDSENIGCKDDLKQKFYSKRSLSIGTEVYYNPETGKKCTTVLSTPGTKGGCMKWYVVKDNSGDSTVDLILDHNTTAKVAWNLTGNNSEMKEVKKALENDTSNWKSGLKPRLITANEIAKITGNTGFDATQTGQDWFYLDSNNQTQTANSTKKSKYAWLFDYTDGCTSYGCNKADSSTGGYWTSTRNIDGSNPAWLVTGSGNLNFYYVDYPGLGVRPVITVSKADV